MSGKLQKGSGLVGITELLRKDALDSKLDLQKTEQRVLNKADDVEEKNESEGSVSSNESSLDDIYKLAKDLNIKIDGLGPDNVSKASRSRRTNLDKLSNLSKSRRTNLDNVDNKTRSRRTKIDKASTLSRASRSVRNDKLSESSREQYKSGVHESSSDASTIHVPVNVPRAPQQYVHNSDDYNFPIKRSKKTVALTEEQVKRDHIDSVIGNIRNETRNTFSTDMERNQDMKANKLEQIASIKMTLNEEGIDTSMITVPSIQSSMEEVNSTLNLLLMKNNRYRYSTLAEEVISAGAEVLESVFDGTRTVPIFNITPDYTGYSSTVNVKLHRLRFETSQIVGDIVEKNNVSPITRILLELVPGFLLYPRVRSKQMTVTGGKKLSNGNSTKSYNSIRSKLEPDNQKNDWDGMNDI